MKDTAPPTTKNPPSLRFDWRDWLDYLDDDTATEDEKRELIETLWSIVLAFVDLGWDVTSEAKSGAKTGGQKIDLKAALEAAVLHSEEIQTGGKEVPHDR